MAGTVVAAEAGQRRYASVGAVRGRYQEERGAVALEFLLLFPFFLLVILGALYFAFAFNAQRALVFVAQSGADAALRVDRSQFDLSGSAGQDAYFARIQAEACDVMLPLLVRQSRTVAESFDGITCAQTENVNGIRFELVDGAQVVLITIEIEPTWRPPLISQFVTTIAGSASVPL